MLVKDPVLRFMDNVRLQPAHPAVVSDEGTVSYKELGDLSVCVASVISQYCKNHIG